MVADSGVGVQDRLFRDRRDAGQTLAGVLERYPGAGRRHGARAARGGVPVAYEVATRLALRSMCSSYASWASRPRRGRDGAPSRAGGVVALNDDVIRGLGISPDVIEQTVEREGRELARREMSYRDGRPIPDVEGRTVILVDDGLATGASMNAAIQACGGCGPAASSSRCRPRRSPPAGSWPARWTRWSGATTPSPFVAVGQSYWDFAQTTDAEVRGPAPRRVEDGRWQR